jgi:hypothetical protein
MNAPGAIRFAPGSAAESPRKPLWITGQAGHGDDEFFLQIVPSLLSRRCR